MRKISIRVKIPKTSQKSMIRPQGRDNETTSSLIHAFSKLQWKLQGETKQRIPPNCPIIHPLQVIWLEHLSIGGCHKHVNRDQIKRSCVSFPSTRILHSITQRGYFQNKMPSSKIETNQNTIILHCQNKKELIFLCHCCMGPWALI